MVFKKPCIVIDCPHLAMGPRCPAHERQWQQVRNALVGRQAYTDVDYRRHRRLVRAGFYGPCVDCGTFEDLTIDHREPLSAGGANTADNWAVRCRPCNSRKGPKRETR